MYKYEAICVILVFIHLYVAVGTELFICMYLSKTYSDVKHILKSDVYWIIQYLLKLREKEAI